jgi:hypothetical protein
MRATIFVFSCLGVLIVFLSKPAGKALNNWQMKTAGVDTGEWFYRLSFMFIGVLLTCLSFLSPFSRD